MVTIEIYPEDEAIIQTKLACGQFHTIPDLIHRAIAALPSDTGDPSRFAAQHFEDSFRRSAVRGMKEFGQRHQLTFGEPITRRVFHQNHRF